METNEGITPEQLYGKIRIFEPDCDEVIPVNIKRADEYCVELIQQAKSEWCKEQRRNCANKFELFKGTPYEKIIEVILNAPEP